jgi:hypothetical protein
MTTYTLAQALKDRWCKIVVVQPEGGGEPILRVFKLEETHRDYVLPGETPLHAGFVKIDPFSPVLWVTEGSMSLNMGIGDEAYPLLAAFYGRIVHHDCGPDLDLAGL